ncbi:MAG: hypothetical protein U1D69_01065, partial [Polynucleobacter sp.]|nr:hypothetical protein [Polynucleobacter sp.]
AQVLFQLTVLSFVFNTISGFYASIIMAHEDMHFFALFSVTEAVLRLGAVLSIGLVAMEQLVTYGVLLCGLSFGLMVAQWLFCARRYAECGLGPIHLELATIRNMLSFASWTILGQISTISRNQAVTILINQAFSPATVVARALAMSISSQVITVSGNLSAALHPPIIKAYASGDRGQTFDLIFTGSRVSFFFIWAVPLPMMATMPAILTLWLGDFPDETTLFVRLALLENAIVAISLPLMTAVRAAGQMRLYEILLGSLQLLVLLISWLLVRAGHPAYSVYVVAIFVNLAMLVVRLKLVSTLTGMSASAYLQEVIFPALLVVGLTSSLTLAVLQIAPGITELSLNPGTILGAFSLYLLPCSIIYALGLTGRERRAVNAIVRRRLKKSI